MLDFTPSERRVIIIITVILLGSAGLQFVRKSITEPEAIDYYHADSIFTRRSHQAHLIQTYKQDEKYSETGSNRQTLKAAETPAPHGRLNINTASAEDLIQLPRIGPAMAKRIIAYRKQNGPFHSLAELCKVKGIGSKTLARIKPYLQDPD